MVLGLSTCQCLADPLHAPFATGNVAKLRNINASSLRSIQKESWTSRVALNFTVVLTGCRKIMALLTLRPVPCYVNAVSSLSFILFSLQTECSSSLTTLRSSGSHSSPSRLARPYLVFQEKCAGTEHTSAPEELGSTLT